MTPDVYLLVPADRYEPVGEAMRALNPARGRKLHWHNNEERHQEITEAICRLEILHLVVVRDGTTGEPAKRRRMKCMERLLYELDCRGIEFVYCETRQEKQNQDDRHLLEVMLARQQVRGRMRMDHPKGPTDPALWIADGVVGAVALARTADPRYQAMLADVLEVIHVGPQT
jgi:hypothetical protein